MFFPLVLLLPGFGNQNPLKQSLPSPVSKDRPCLQPKHGWTAIFSRILAKKIIVLSNDPPPPRWDRTFWSDPWGNCNFGGRQTGDIDKK